MCSPLFLALGPIYGLSVALLGILEVVLCVLSMIYPSILFCSLNLSAGVADLVVPLWGYSPRLPFHHSIDTVAIRWLSFTRSSYCASISDGVVLLAGQLRCAAYTVTLFLFITHQLKLSLLREGIVFFFSKRPVISSSSTTGGRCKPWQASQLFIGHLNLSHI